MKIYKKQLPDKTRRVPEEGVKESLVNAGETRGKSFNKSDILPFCFSVSVLALMVAGNLIHDTLADILSGRRTQVLIGVGVVLISSVFIYLVATMGRSKTGDAESE